MNVYMIQLDEGTWIVEADTIPEALRIWQRFTDEVREPEFIELLDDKPVLRAGDIEEKTVG